MQRPPDDRRVELSRAADGVHQAHERRLAGVGDVPARRHSGTCRTRRPPARAATTRRRSNAAGAPSCDVPVTLHPSIREEWYLSGDQRNRFTFNGIWDAAAACSSAASTSTATTARATPTSGVDALQTGSTNGRVRADGIADRTQQLRHPVDASRRRARAEAVQLRQQRQHRRHRRSVQRVQPRELPVLHAERDQRRTTGSRPKAPTWRISRACCSSDSAPRSNPRTRASDELCRPVVAPGACRWRLSRHRRPASRGRGHDAHARDRRDDCHAQTRARGDSTWRKRRSPMSTAPSRKGRSPAAASCRPTSIGPRRTTASRPRWSRRTARRFPPAPGMVRAGAPLKFPTKTVKRVDAASRISISTPGRRSNSAGWRRPRPTRACSSSSA